MYIEFILKNFDFYSDNLYKKGIIDPFYGTSSGGQYLSKYMANHLGCSLLDIKEFYKKCVCFSCNKEYSQNIFGRYIKKSCGNYDCRTKETVKTRNINYPITKNKTNKLRIFNNSIVINEIRYTDYAAFKNWCVENNKDYYGWLKNNHKECFSNCVVCKQDFLIKDNPKITYTNKSVHVCNRKCYIEALKQKNPIFYSIETGKKTGETLRKNGYIPKNNSFVFKFEYNGQEFRSTWEVIFHILNKNLNYEVLKIPYWDTQTQKQRTYSVDFCDDKNKILYEIKPICKLKDSNVIDKIKAAKEWCNDNYYEYEIITEKYFIENIEKIENILTKHEINVNIRKPIMNNLQKWKKVKNNENSFN